MNFEQLKLLVSKQVEGQKTKLLTHSKLPLKIPPKFLFYFSQQIVAKFQPWCFCFQAITVSLNEPKFGYISRY